MSFPIPFLTSWKHRPSNNQQLVSFAPVAVLNSRLATSSARTLAALLLAALVVLVLGATAASGEVDHTGPERTPTLAGETDFVEPGTHAWVGFVLFRGTGCTGSLVADDWVLTAAHCIPEGAENDGEVYLGINDARSLDRADAISVQRVVVHPEYRSETSSLLRISHDIALLQLERSAKAEPVQLAVSPLAARHGAKATMIGFGDICAGCGADDRLRVGASTFLGDRKNPSLARAFRRDLALVAFTNSADLTSEAGICAGDSGGPVLGEVAGHSGLTAVLSNEIFLAEDGQVLSCGGAGYSIGVHVEVAAGTPNGNWIFETIGGRPKCGGIFATIVGTSQPDILRGTSGRDVIVGGGGNDRISGAAGRDIICGGAGNDTIRGDAGSDILRGGGGADVLLGNVGKDRCIGDGSDSMVGCERRAVLGAAMGGKK